MNRHRAFDWKEKWIVPTVGIAATVGVILIGTFPGVGLASPGSGVTATTLVTGDLEMTVRVDTDRAEFQTKNSTDVRVQKIDFAPGGNIGWHHHPGFVIVAVHSGALTLMDSECTSVTYGPGLADGAVFVMSGDDPMYTSSATGATVYATFIAPRADPPVFRIEDDPLPCA